MRLDAYQWEVSIENYSFGLLTRDYNLSAIDIFSAHNLIDFSGNKQQLIGKVYFAGTAGMIFDVYCNFDRIPYDRGVEVDEA